MKQLLLATIITCLVTGSISGHNAKQKGQSTVGITTAMHPTPHHEVSHELEFGARVLPDVTLL